MRKRVVLEMGVLVCWVGLQSTPLGWTMTVNVKGRYDPSLARPPRVETREDMGGVSGNIAYVTKPTFRWIPILGRGVTEYQLELARDQDFRQLDSLKNISGESTAAYTWEVRLVDGIVYYWRMRARNANGYGPWSVTRHFRVDLSYAPPPPTLRNPRNGETNLVSRPTFEWEAVPGATQYRIEISGVPSFLNIVDVIQTSSTSGVLTPGRRLEPGTVYYWRAKSYRGDFEGPFGEGWSFTTINDTDRPIIRNLQPTTIETTQIPASRRFTVEVIDQGSPLSGIERVIFTLGGWETGSRIVSEQTTSYEGNIYTAEIGGLNEGINRIGIQAIDNAGNFIRVVFNVDVKLITIPDIPTWREPRRGSRVNTSRPTFRWDRVDNASYYSLELREESMFGKVVFKVPRLFTTSLVSPRHLSNGKYVWRLKAWSTTGNPSGENVGLFEVVLEQPGELLPPEISRPELEKRPQLDKGELIIPR